MLQQKYSQTAKSKSPSPNFSVCSGRKIFVTGFPYIHFLLKFNYWRTPRYFGEWRASADAVPITPYSHAHTTSKYTPQCTAQNILFILHTNHPINLIKDMIMCSYHTICCVLPSTTMYCHGLFILWSTDFLQNHWYTCTVYHILWHIHDHVLQCWISLWYWCAWFY